MGMGLVTLSAMAVDNPLRALGDVNFWLDSRAYNIIETVHQFWMMSAIDLIIGEAEYVADRVNEVVPCEKPSSPLIGTAFLLN